MIIRIDCLRNTKIHAALAHSFQIAIKSFVLGKEKANDLSGGIINGAMEGIFDGASKLFVRRGVNLDQLSGIGFSFPPMGTTDFFLFGALKTCIF